MHIVAITRVQAKLHALRDPESALMKYDTRVR